MCQSSLRVVCCCLMWRNFHMCDLKFKEEKLTTLEGFWYWTWVVQQTEADENTKTGYCPFGSSTPGSLVSRYPIHSNSTLCLHCAISLTHLFEPRLHHVANDIICLYLFDVLNCVNLWGCVLFLVICYSNCIEKRVCCDVYGKGEHKNKINTTQLWKLELMPDSFT